MFHLSARSLRHCISDGDGWPSRLLLNVIHLYVEVALPLEIVAKPSIALIQQIFIDRAFFKHRHQPLQAIARSPLHHPRSAVTTGPRLAENVKFDLFVSAL